MNAIFRHPIDSKPVAITGCTNPPAANPSIIRASAVVRLRINQFTTATEAGKNEPRAFPKAITRNAT